MSELIKLLPDHIANQIAAGEVIQRPASVVKELVENSIDAGATKITLSVKDAGKTLVQVIDNGSGMSEGDARMSFERHATSKIASADDLYSLKTMGFRGEALASICAIAHVQMKTKQVDNELGIEIINEGSEITSQEPIMCTDGTSIAVKNLFYNVPARRNFLGKDATEYRHVLDEFLRVALVNPEIEMNFFHNDEEVYLLPKQNMRQRIVQIFGKAYDQRLVPVSEETDIIKISGYVTKPEFSRTQRDQQYLFVNNRFFKDRYFNHAILNAYEGLIPNDKFPSYFLFFEVPASSIDVNVHPTKTEIKFEENQSIYAILRSAVKQALGKFNIAPTLDFEQETAFETPALKKGETVKMPEIQVNPEYNPFKTTSSSGGGGSSSNYSGNGYTAAITPSKNWDSAGEDFDAEKELLSDQENVTIPSQMNSGIEAQRKKPIQLHEKYILTSIKNGFLLIDQYRAHYRVIYDQLLAASEGTKMNAQKLLFKETLEIDQPDLVVWKEIAGMLREFGFEIEVKERFVEVEAIPADTEDLNPIKILKDIFSSYIESEMESDLDVRERVLRTAAASMAIRGGTTLSTEEMEHLIDSLFASESPQFAPNGKKIIETITLDELTQRFN